MRLLAQFKFDANSTGDRHQVVAHQLRNRGFLLPTDDLERSQFMTLLVEDLGPEDKSRFENTVETVYRHGTNDVLASISLLGDDSVMLRFRHALLQRVIPVGGEVVTAIMTGPATQAQQPPQLVSCEARERAGSEGFLFAQWRSGTMKFRQFLFAQRRATFIVPFLVIGLATQIVLTLRPQHDNEVWELALRLSGPMFVTSLVLILERWAQWRDQVEPMLRWSTSRPEGKTPLTPDTE